MERARAKLPVMKELMNRTDSEYHLKLLKLEVYLHLVDQPDALIKSLLVDFSTLPCGSFIRIASL